MDEYIGVFDPLVLEEAREGLKSDWAEGCAARGWPVEVVGCAARGAGRGRAGGALRPPPGRERVPRCRAAPPRGRLLRAGRRSQAGVLPHAASPPPLTRLDPHPPSRPPTHSCSVEELAEGWANLRVRALAGHADLKRACPNNTGGWVGRAMSRQMAAEGCGCCQ